MIAFVRRALARGQRVLGFLAPSTISRARGYLSASGLDVEALETGGQLRFLFWDEGSWGDPRRWIAALRAEAPPVGGHVVCEFPRGIEGSSGAEGFGEHEVLLDEWLSRSACVGLCLYDVRGASPRALLHALRAHPRVGVGKFMCDNPFFDSPRGHPEGEPQAATLRRWLQMLAEHSDLAALLEARTQELDKAFHQNAVLRAMRDVNRLVVRADDPHALVEGACRLLVGARGYLSAWIALLDEEGRPSGWAASGKPEDLAGLIKAWKASDPPVCVVQALAGEGSVWVEQPVARCPTCPVARVCGPAACLAVPLKHEGKAQGVLVVALPSRLVGHDDERGLLQELAGDLAHALAGIEHRRAWQAAEGRRKQLLEALARVSEEAVTSLGDVERICSAVHAAVAALMPAEAFVIALQTGEDQAQAVYLVDAGGRYSPESVPKGEGITWHVLTTGRSVFLSDTTHGFPFRERRFGSGERVRSLIAAPIRAGGRTLGMISAQSYRPRAFTGEDLRLLEALAAPLGGVVEMARLLSALRENEDRFRRLAENAPDAIYRFRLRPVAGFEYLSPAAEAITGYRSEEFLADPGLGIRLVHPEDRPFLAGLSRREEFSRESILLRVRRRDGKEVWLELLNVPICDDSGCVVALEGIARDVTARKRAEEELRQVQEKYRRLVEQLPGVVYLLDFDRPFPRRTAYISPRIQDLLGFTVEEWLEDPELWIRQIAPEDRERVLAAVRELNDAREPFDLTYRVRRRDGRTVWIRNITSVFPESSGLRRFAQGIMLDVTAEVEEARRLGQALDQTVEALSTAMDLREPYTAGHQRRVAELACALAEEMGLPPEQVRGLRVAALLHDLGKALFVPIEILSKPGKLNALEMALVREHPRAGYEILRKVDFPWPVAEIVYQHHERLDGSGYPRGLAGEAILLEARILAVADVVDAMVTHRPYRPAYPAEVALTEVRRGRGTLYDAAVVGALERLWKVSRLPFDRGASGG